MSLEITKMYVEIIKDNVIRFGLGSHREAGYRLTGGRKSQAGRTGALVYYFPSFTDTLTCWPSSPKPEE